MLTKSETKTKVIDSDSVSLNSNFTAQILTKVRKANYIVQPSGYSNSKAEDFWIHMEFGFDAEKAEVVVDGWWVTDSRGVEISLSRLSYTQVQFLADAIREEQEAHVKAFYDELESAHYSNK
jgi:hypothetical protein